MAEFQNSFGKIRGKIGNVINYVGPSGKNYCRSASFKRRPGDEPQKRHAAAFGTVVGMKGWLAKAIRLGFPGGNGYPKGFNGFTSANVMEAVTTEKIHPDKPIRRYKKAPEEFRGIIDYEKLRVAAGQLTSPVVRAEVEMESRKVFFNHEGIPLESVDCFLDDVIYGVVFHEQRHFCLVKELGTRGETFSASMDIAEKAVEEEIVVYVFARSADGKDASDSVCLRAPME